jgi:hypothetical protein
MIDWNKVRDEAHQTAVDKCWWTEDRPDRELIMLMVTEVAEATEEVRSRKPPIYQLHGGQVVQPGEVLFSNSVKSEGEIVEFADVLIRIADMFGARKWNMEPTQATCNSYFNTSEDPLSYHLYLCEMLMKGVLVLSPHDSTEIQYWLRSVVKSIDSHCKCKSINLEIALKAKMEYNKTRPARHGNKKF